MAESGRPDYDRLIRFSQLDPGEPFFFIRGRDRVAGAAVRAWAALASRAGAPAAIVESALEQADRLDDWPTKQLPDADHLSRAEQLEFEHRLNRRAWNHRIANPPNEAVLLAEARGAAAVRGQQRHADALLLDLVEALAPIVGSTAPREADQDRALKALMRVALDLAHRHPETALPDMTQPESTQPESSAPEAAGELVPFVQHLEQGA